MASMYNNPVNTWYQNQYQNQYQAPGQPQSPAPPGSPMTRVQRGIGQPLPGQNQGQPIPFQNPFWRALFPTGTMSPWIANLFGVSAPQAQLTGTPLGPTPQAGPRAPTPPAYAAPSVLGPEAYGTAHGIPRPTVPTAVPQYNNPVNTWYQNQYQNQTAHGIPRPTVPTAVPQYNPPKKGAEQFKRPFQEFVWSQQRNQPASVENAIRGLSPADVRLFYQALGDRAARQVPRRIVGRRLARRKTTMRRRLARRKTTST
jgi:hypothetical protein